VSNEFGQRLRELRQKRGLTQTALGTRIGVTHAAISLIEHGHRMPTLTQLIALMDAFDLEPMDRISFLSAAGVKIVSQLVE
jgi:transcriptional regulator with XRE-family HTH domain